MQLRVDVGEKQVPRACVRRGEFGIEVAEDVEFREERLALVDVFEVPPPPAKRLAVLDVAKPLGVDAPAAQGDPQGLAVMADLVAPGRLEPRPELGEGRVAEAGLAGDRDEAGLVGLERQREPCEGAADRRGAGLKMD